MRALRPISIFGIILLTIMLTSSCEEKNPTQQAISIFNGSDYTLDQIILQSGSQSLTFQDISMDSTSAVQYAEELQSDLDFEILIGEFDIPLNWELPDQLSEILDGNMFKSGEYEFSISNIELDSINDIGIATVVLSEYIIGFSSGQ